METITPSHDQISRKPNTQPPRGGENAENYVNDYFVATAPASPHLASRRTCDQSNHDPCDKSYTKCFSGPLEAGRQGMYTQRR